MSIGDAKVKEPFTITIELGDPQGPRFEDVDALVDTGATLTTAPESLLRRIGVSSRRKGAFGLANGQQVEKDMAETWVTVEGLETIPWVLFGDEAAPALPGALTLEGVHLFNRRLVPVDGILM